MITSSGSSDMPAIEVPDRRLPKAHDAAGRQSRFVQVPTLQLSCVRNVRAFRSQGGAHLFRSFAGE